MNKDTYSWIWQKVAKQIDDITNLFSEEDKKRYHFRLTYRSNEATKKEIFDEYNTVRDNLKIRCYDSKTEYELNQERIDYHKIAACFCCALINKKVFAFDIDDKIPNRMLVSNYILAYNVSVMIVYWCLLSCYSASNLKNREQYVEKLKEKKRLYVPRTSHEAYSEGRIKVLANNDYYGLGFNLLMYSDMLYWLEHFTRQNIEGKIDIEPFKFDDENTLDIGAD